MSYEIITVYINTTSFVLISQLEKDHSMIETRRLKNLVIFSKQSEVLRCQERLYIFTMI